MFLSLVQYSVFASIFTFGAMIGAIVSGKIADLIGRRGVLFGFYIGSLLAKCDFSLFYVCCPFKLVIMQAIWLCDIFYTMGWLAILFAKVLFCKFSPSPPLFYVRILFCTKRWLKLDFLSLHSRLDSFSEV